MNKKEFLVMKEKNEEISRLQQKEKLLETIIKTLTQLYDEKTDRLIEVEKELMALKKEQA
jgi:hypothetical protein